MGKAILFVTAPPTKFRAVSPYGHGSGNFGKLKFKRNDNSYKGITAEERNDIKRFGFTVDKPRRKENDLGFNLR